MSLVSDERVEEMLAEIERLRRDEGLIRNIVIEECARVAETYSDKRYRPCTITKADVAAAIRQLKDKP